MAQPQNHQINSKINNNWEHKINHFLEQIKIHFLVIFLLLHQHNNRHNRNRIQLMCFLEIILKIRQMEADLMSKIMINQVEIGDGDMKYRIKIGIEIHLIMVGGLLNLNNKVKRIHFYVKH